MEITCRKGSISDGTQQRLFRKFTQATNERVLGALYRWLFAQLAVDGLTLDLDSTVMTRYGQQEGATRGYNPSKRGRTSPPPLMALVSDLRMVANCWLRPGNSHPANNVSKYQHPQRTWVVF